MTESRISSGLLAAPEKLLKLGIALMHSGEGAKAAALVRTLLAQSSGDLEADSLARAILSHHVPRWHAAMLHDEPRNAAFERAIARAVTPATRVLDIGTGSGLLAMMAARSGARSVLACEAHPALAETARAIVAANGCSDRVEVVAKRSTDLDRDADLVGGADLIIAEIFSDDLLNEGALATLGHARATLASTAARIIPARATIRAAPAWHPDARRMHVDRVRGFGLSLFQPHVPHGYPVKIGDRRLRLAGEAVDLFTFDFEAGEPFSTGQVRRALAVSDGPVNGLVQWIRLQLDAEDVYENRPAVDASSHWAAIFYPLPAGEEEQGGMLAVHARHDTERLHVWFDRPDQE